VPQSVWVSGEALIDLLPGQSVNSLRAIVGGGPANTAIALAKLGVPVKFVSGLSKDRFGKQIATEFNNYGVELDLAVWSDLPTCLAVVSLDDQGRADYHFHIKDTATFDFDQTLLPESSPGAPNILYVGTLATLIEPGATKLMDWARRVSEHALVVFDPNIRVSVLSDRKAYLASVERWIEIANVVKVSDDDLKFLFPAEDPITVAKAWISTSCPLVVVTRGENGLVAVTANEVIEVPASKTIIVDSVGAGDTVGAIIVEALTRNSLKDLHGQTLRTVMQRAAKAAAITCSRAGSQPPTAAELDKETI